MLALRLIRPHPPSDLRLQKILENIAEHLQPCRPLDGVLRALDASKRSLFTCLRDHFDSSLVAKALTLKIQNLCLAQYHFRARSMRVLAAPFGLIVDPANGCGLACPGCVHSARSRKLELFTWEKGMLSGDLLAALLNRCGPWSLQVVFCNYGEPLFNPATPQYIRLAKSWLMGTALSSSLSVRHFDAEEYVRSGLDYFTVSIDGATQAVYEHFRRNGNLSLVFDNVRKLVAAKRRLGKRTPVISWQFLAFEHNAHEIPLAERTARELGVNQLVVGRPFDVSWDDPGMRPADCEPVRIEFDWESEPAMAENWNPFPDGLHASAIESEFELRWRDRFAPTVLQDATSAGVHTCHSLYKNMAMDAAGRIFPCCAAPRRDALLTFTSFDGATMSDPFNSENHRLARLSFADRDRFRLARTLRPHERDPYCANCDWDQDTAAIDTAQARQYFHAAADALFNEASLRTLCSW